MAEESENNGTNLSSGAPEQVATGLTASKDDKQSEVDEVEVSKELSKVASNQKRDMMILIFVAIILAYIAYQVFAISTASNPQTQSVAQAPAPVARPVEVIKPVADVSKSNIPALPELPKMATPKVVEEPKEEEKHEEKHDDTAVKKDEVTPVIPPMPTISAPSVSLPSAVSNNKSPTNVDAQKRAEAKRKSSMVLVSGQQSGKTEKEVEMMNDFKYRGDLSYVLGKGKIIDAVIETTINTDFQGDIVANVSRDVYSENAKVLLIPKGSRIFGKASSGSAGTGRIDISWNRIDLPSGYSLNLSGDTVDSLGRKGVHGRLDNKYKEQITNTILSSTISILTAAALDKVVPPVATSGTSAEQTALANSVTTTVNGINTNAAYADAAAKVYAICAQVPVISGIATSSIYSSIQSACNTAQASVGTATDGGTAALATLIASVNTAVTGLNVSIANNSTPSQQQSASQQAFKDITSKVGEILTKQDSLSPTTTLNQGESVRIYVNRDYTFPKAALNKSRFVQ